jgi:hypothetical protein
VLVMDDRTRLSRGTSAVDVVMGMVGVMGHV